MVFGEMSMEAHAVVDVGTCGLDIREFVRTRVCMIDSI